MSWPSSSSEVDAERLDGSRPRATPCAATLEAADAASRAARATRYPPSSAISERDAAGDQHAGADEANGRRARRRGRVRVDRHPRGCFVAAEPRPAPSGCHPRRRCSPEGGASGRPGPSAPGRRRFWSSPWSWRAAGTEGELRADVECRSIVTRRPGCPRASARARRTWAPSGVSLSAPWISGVKAGATRRSSFRRWCSRLDSAAGRPRRRSPRTRPP